MKIIIVLRMWDAGARKASIDSYLSPRIGVACMPKIMIRRSARFYADGDR